MHSIYTKLTSEAITKQTFQVKPVHEKGLILRIHHVIGELHKIRFVHVCYNNTGHVLATGDSSGSIFIIDFSVFKFWGLPNVGSCTVLRFSVLNDNEILIGLATGTVLIINIHTGEVVSHLESHEQPVTQISFSRDHMCITSSRSEAVIWDLKTHCKLHTLTLETDCILKHVSFTPVSNNILVCFHDNEIHIWKYGTFEKFTVISPALWNKYSVKTITFTRNGRAFLIAGHSSHIAVFLVDEWTLAKMLPLPNVLSVKYIDFIPQPFDGGCNRLLGVLSGNGTFYFYDVEDKSVLNTITGPQQIVKFASTSDGKYLACLSCSGEVCVYDVAKYLVNCKKRDRVTTDRSGAKVLKSKKQLCQKLFLRKELNDMMNTEKLIAILKEFGQYPDTYRLTIWKHLLQLPDNKDQYNSIINRFTYPGFENLENEYPLENKTALKNLKRVLNNIVTWCSFFAHVKYLPVLVFPFAKVFHNEPVLCFEAACTIIVNWCQHWFEYFPLPPINVLGMIENILYEHDVQLLQHLSFHMVTSEMYAWPLLESAFSEVLTASEWCILWDHILSNEPSFLLMTIVAYSILNHSLLMTFTDVSDFKHFYRHQNPINVKRLVAKSYCLFNNTSEKNHPKSYLNLFNKLEVGEYPRFANYPVTLIDYENKATEDIRKQQEIIQIKESDLFAQRLQDYRQLLTLQLRDEENARLEELEKLYRRKITKEQERLRKQQERLLELQKQLQQEEVHVLNECRNKIMHQNTTVKQRQLERLIEDLESDHSGEIAVKQAEQNLLNHYAQLIRHKLQIEKLLTQESKLEDGPLSEHSILLKQQKQLSTEIEKNKKITGEQNCLKQLNIATGVSAMDDLIKRVEGELAREMNQQYNHLDNDESDIKIQSLKAETKELETEVTKLLALLAQARTRNSKEKPKERQCSLDDTNVPHVKQPHLHEIGKEMKLLNKYYVPNDLAKDSSFRNIVHAARDGYEAPPTSPHLINCPKKCNHGDEMCTCKLCSVGSFPKTV